MKNLNVYKIPATTQTKIKPKIASNPSFFPNEIKSISFAAKSMCEWVRAVASFTDINKEIEKKKAFVEQMNNELSIANKQLQTKREELSAIVKKVEELESEYQSSKQEKDRLNNEIRLTQSRLLNAEELT